jgi:hypothetical protein
VQHPRTPQLESEREAYSLARIVDFEEELKLC